MKFKAVCAAFALLFVAASSIRVSEAFSHAAPPPQAAEALELPSIALSSPISGFTQPVTVTHAGDGSGRLFVVEQTGRIRVVKNGALLAAPFLDIRSRVLSGGERGLLGLAFPPAYAGKGYFYVNYTRQPDGDTVIARYRRSAANPDLADPASEQIILTIAQPFANHNGGQLAFGPRDGYLYIGMGDGGSGGDPGNRAQNPNELLGKVLRLDVETGRPATYVVPGSNPFVNRAGFRPEIWSLGMRNPWRFSFDRVTQDLLIADVGQGSIEEIDFESVASRGGVNYGWRILEGTRCFITPGCVVVGLTPPVWEYDHSQGDCSVTGGYVYRGSKYPNMQGLYVYGDFCTGRIWGLRREAGVWRNTLLLDSDLSVSTFGEDEAGNLYVASYGAGTVFQVTDTKTPGATVRISNASLSIAESAGSVEFTVTRTGDTTTAGTVSYATSDGTATETGDYTTAVGTLQFAPGETTKTFRLFITDDAFAEGDETLNLNLLNTTGGFAVADAAPAALVIRDDDATAGANPNDDVRSFVRQHYIDFLNREPDAPGLQFWMNNITSCGTDARCVADKRTDTSAAFFLSIEFQRTGYLVYRFHQAAFATGERLPLRTFLQDTQQISKGVIVGDPVAEVQLEQNKRAFADEFVTRPLFTALYPTTLTAAQYVDALNANTGGSLSQAERDALVSDLTTGAKTRAEGLRQVAEDADFRAREFNRAFVLMQYFGYLRRNPNDPPEAALDFAGFNFWLTKLNEFGGDFRRAEMVKSFIVSAEYRGRFGRP